MRILFGMLLVLLFVAVLISVCYNMNVKQEVCESRGLEPFYAHNRLLCVDPQTRIVYLP